MKIILNNRTEELPFEEINMEELIKFKNFTFKLLVTKINGKVIKKDERIKSTIKNGDTVMVMHLISGG